MSGHHWVFGYGPNMHLADLRRFFAERGCRSDGILRAERARMRGYRLAWSYFSRVRDGAAANVVCDPGGEGSELTTSPS